VAAAAAAFVCNQIKGRRTPTPGLAQSNVSRHADPTDKILHAAFELVHGNRKNDTPWRLNMPEDFFESSGDI
jgi:hypothetical protein